MLPSPEPIPTAVTAKLWFFIFAENGIANKMLGTDIAWTTDQRASRFVVILADVERRRRSRPLPVLAGLQLIPSGRVQGRPGRRGVEVEAVRPHHAAAGETGADGGGCCSVRSTCPGCTITGHSVGHQRRPPTTTVDPGGRRHAARHFSSLGAVDTGSLMIFAVAFIMVKFLGANVVRALRRSAKESMTSATSVRMASNANVTGKTFPVTAHLRRRWYRSRCGGLAPFYWMVITSFRDVKHFLTRAPWWPAHVTLPELPTRCPTAKGTTSAPSSTVCSQAPSPPSR